MLLVVNKKQTYAYLYDSLDQKRGGAISKCLYDRHFKMHFKSIELHQLSIVI